jgi:GABA permease
VPGKDRQEFLAIPLVAAAVVVFGLLFVALVVGTWAWWLFLLAVVALAVAGGVLYSRRHRRPPIESAPRSAPTAGASDGPYRVLVVADESCTSPALRDALAQHASGRSVEAFVVAPALGSRLARWTGDEGAYADAQSRLDATLAALGETGIEARGRLGSHDPIQAADDGLREFPAEEIVFATRSDGGGRWLEDGVVETARERYDLPVRHVVVDAS